jgi:hypothetical protein
MKTQLYFLKYFQFQLKRLIKYFKYWFLKLKRIINSLINYLLDLLYKIIKDYIRRKIHPFGEPIY